MNNRHADDERELLEYEAERQQRHALEAEHTARVNDRLRSYRERMERAAKAQRLDNAHIDLSKEGIGKHSSPQREAPDPTPPIQPPVPSPARRDRPPERPSSRETSSARVDLPPGIQPVPYDRRNPPVRFSQSIQGRVDPASTVTRQTGPFQASYVQPSYEAERNSSGTARISSAQSGRIVRRPHAWTNPKVPGSEGQAPGGSIPYEPTQRKEPYQPPSFANQANVNDRLATPEPYRRPGQYMAPGIQPVPYDRRNPPVRFSQSIQGRVDPASTVTRQTGPFQPSHVRPSYEAERNSSGTARISSAQSGRIVRRPHAWTNPEAPGFKGQAPGGSIPYEPTQRKEPYQPPSFANQANVNNRLATPEPYRRPGQYMAPGIQPGQTLREPPKQNWSHQAASHASLRNDHAGTPERFSQSIQGRVDPASTVTRQTGPFQASYVRPSYEAERNSSGSARNSSAQSGRIVRRPHAWINPALQAPAPANAAVRPGTRTNPGTRRFYPSGAQPPFGNTLDNPSSFPWSPRTGAPQQPSQTIQGRVDPASTVTRQAGPSQASHGAGLPTTPSQNSPGGSSQGPGQPATGVKSEPNASPRTHYRLKRMIYGLKNGSYAVIYTAAQTVANKAASSVDNDAVRGVRQAQYYASIAGNTLYALRHLDVTKDLKKDIQWSKADKSFLHSRKLEQEILDAYQSTGKWQLSSSKVTRISYEFLELKRQMLRDQFGSLADLSDRKLQEEIQRLLTDSRILKSRVLRLEAKGSALTPEERKQLLQLRKKLKEMGQNIGLRKRAIQSKADFRFQEKKIHHIQDIANRNRRGVMSQLQLLRTIVLTPLRSGLDSQTDGLGYAVSIATNRTVHRVVKGAAKTSFAALKLSGRGLWWAAGKAAPGVTIAAEAGAQTAKAQIRHSVHGLKAGAQKGAAFVGRTISNAVPTSIKSTAYAVHRQYKAVQTGVKTAISATKHLAASAPAGKAYTSVRWAGRKAANAVKEGLLLLKALLGKVALFAGGGLLTLILMTGFLMVIVSIIGGSMITAPYESGGKIDLSPYTQILRQEMSSFTGRLEELVAAYQENPSYNRVDLAYHGTRNNFREILSMMAVRLEQDLSIEDNPNVEAYLADLFDSSTSYTLSERRYYCSGCKEREVISEDPVTGDPITEIETYCPGHIDVTIDVQILSFDEIFDVDHFDPSDASWDGWTEENREWAVRIYNMDWAELYTGVDLFSQGSADFGTVTSSPQERYIWNYLVRLTGSEYAAAGIMGNLYAESGLIPNNLQDEYEASLGYTDEGYTQAVDNGTYSGFTSDSAGYGLVQWTYPDRKEQLLALARERGTSIGDLTTQLEMVSVELTSASLLEDLQNTSSVSEASDIVMLRYERPANQSAEARQRRTSYSQYFYNKMVHGIASEGELTEKQMEVIRIATNSGSYGISAVQGYCQAWAADVYEAAGLPRDGSCCAYHSGMSYGVSSDWSVIPPGAAVYGYAGQQYGHVGIYVGNGLVYHNIGGVAIDTLSDWISYYDGFAWGWEGGADLTTFD